MTQKKKKTKINPAKKTQRKKQTKKKASPKPKNEEIIWRVGKKYRTTQPGLFYYVIGTSMRGDKILVETPAGEVITLELDGTSPNFPDMVNKEWEEPFYHQHVLWVTNSGKEELMKYPQFFFDGDIEANLTKTMVFKHPIRVTLEEVIDGQ